MQDGRATKRHGVARKRSTKRLKDKGNLLKKNPQSIRCLLALDLQPFRSLVKGKHSIAREFQSLTVRGKKLLT